MADLPDRIWIETRHIPGELELNQWEVKPDDGELQYFTEFARVDNAIPQGTAEGGASFEAEVRWAHDALKRNDTKLAKDRLARVLKGLS